MAECFTCKVALTGTWNLTDSGPSYEKTGRYLGVNGYFCYAGQPKWVYCYCLNCYKTEILKLAVQYQATLPQDINTLLQQKTQLTTETTSLQQQKTQLTTDTTTLQQQKAQLTTEMTSLQQTHQLTHETASLLQQKTQLTTDTTTLHNEVATFQTRIVELKQQVEEVLGSTGANQLRSVVEGLSENEAQVLQIDPTSFPHQLKSHLKEAASKFVKTYNDRFLVNIDNSKNTLNKNIEASERATENMLANMRDAQVPESVTTKVVNEMKAHVTSLREQLAKWNVYKNRIEALAPPD